LIQLKLCFPQSSEDFPEIPGMFLPRRPDDDDVIQVGEGVGFHIRPDEAVKGLLERCWGRMQSKGHDFPVEESTPRDGESRAFAASFRQYPFLRSSVEMNRAFRSRFNMWLIRGSGYASGMECALSCR